MELAGGSTVTSIISSASLLRPNLQPGTPVSTIIMASDASPATA